MPILPLILLPILLSILPPVLPPILLPIRSMRLILAPLILPPARESVWLQVERLLKAERVAPIAHPDVAAHDQYARRRLPSEHRDQMGARRLDHEEGLLSREQARGRVRGRAWRVVWDAGATERQLCFLRRGGGRSRSEGGSVKRGARCVCVCVCV